MTNKWGVMLLLVDEGLSLQTREMFQQWPLGALDAPVCLSDHVRISLALLPHIK